MKLICRCIKKEKFAQAPDKNPFGAKPTFLLTKLYPINYYFINKKENGKVKRIKVSLMKGQNYG